MKKLLVAVVLALSTTACSSEQGIKSAWQQGYGRSFYEPNKGMAALYIIRDDSVPDTSLIDITMGRESVGSLAGPGWMRVDLPPSYYDLRAYGTDANTNLIITVNAGESRFFVAQSSTPPGNAQLFEVLQPEGRRLVRKGQRVYSNPNLP
jgi:hypothetical protein